MSKKMMRGLCMVLYLQCKKRGEAYLQVLRSGYIRNLLLIFIQRVELLYDLRVFQLDDLAGEVVEGIFLGNVEKADADGAEGLRLSAGALVHLAVAVLDVAQHRLAR